MAEPGDVPSHSCVWVRGVVNLFASQGVDTGWLFHEARIDPGRLRHAHARFTLAEVDLMWRLAVRQTRQETLGLDRSLARRHVQFNIAIQSMWSSPHLAAGLAVLEKYLHLINDASGFRLVADRGDRWLVLEHVQDSPRQRVEFTMFSFLLLCQSAAHHPVRPPVIEFTFPEPADLHPYRMAFHCPLRFGQPAIRMKLSRDDLALPIRGAGESLFAIQEHVIEDRLARFGQARTSYRASEEIIRRLHLGEPKRDEVARSLGMPATAFEKRLRTEGTSFDDLLDGVRRELAEHYLHQDGYTPTRVANLLGWEMPAELAAACKRWFGMPTAQYRNQAG
jgi:AraC-like DNA-binding protein